MSKPSELKVVATAANQPEGELIVARLAQAGISAIEQRASGNAEFGGSGGRYIYVQDADVERARAVLDVEQPPFTDEELARLSEEAAREARE
ncbi:MAG: hypothetical protein ACHQHO_07705 [Solirubrobacterales bacterium]